MGAIDVADAPAMAAWLTRFDHDHPVDESETIEN